MTTPAGPTVTITYKPILSPQKSHALRTIQYSSSNKVILVFEHPFWEEKFGEEGGATMTDLPVKQIYYQMNAQTSGI
jgi:monoamine oxidase